MCIGKNTESDIFKFENVYLENSKEKLILEITIDNKLTFDSHIRSICWKAGQKLSALSNKKELLFKSMVKSQFSYCPLAWMFCSQNSNKNPRKVSKINYEWQNECFWTSTASKQRNNNISEKFASVNGGSFQNN